MVTFNYTQFIARYPQFITIPEPDVTDAFYYEAVIIGSPITNQLDQENVQYYWLCVVLAHILTLQQSGQTGRVSSAGEGSESVSLDFNAPQWASYWTQTIYGQRIYQLMLQLLAGGHYIWDGQDPYLSNTMNGAGSLAWVVI